MSEVIVVIGPGSIGQAIARRVSAGKHVVLADLRQANADAAADTLRKAGFDVSTTTVDVSARESVLGALTAKQNAALATTPAEELLNLPMLQPDQVSDPLHAYQLAKRGNALRVMAEAVRWANRGARINTISPGIIITPLAVDELTGPRGEGYRRMIDHSSSGRAGTPDEVATVAALLLGSDGGFITGSDFLMDGGVTASYFFGELAPRS
jgi:NAD(P)-dependent dehydrogenase (short-subunit alcohol dehydrogenase family)